MKLKYYLRGAGIGIIFATLVMTVSSFAHRFNLSDEYIIKEARKLGMVMKEELKEDEGLWGSSDTEDLITEETEDTQQTEVDTQETESESQKPETPVVPEEPETPTVPETPVEPETPEEPETPVVNQDSDHVTLVVVSGDTPRKVGEKLVAAGVIEDEVAFMNYVGARGNGYDLKRGTYSIPKEATFEEICVILFD